MRPARLERLVVAELSRPHGIRGEIAARLADVDGEDLVGIELWLQPAKGPATPVRLVRARPASSAWILTLDGVHDRNGAERLRGATLLAAREDLPETAPGEWYVVDLVGLRVVDAELGELGRLEEVLKLPANDVFVVRGERGEVLVPVLEDVILDTDEAAGVMHVRVPAGLLDPVGGEPGGEA